MDQIVESSHAAGASRTTAPRRPAEERGVVIVWALLTTFIVAGIVLTATERINAIDSLANFEFSAHGQAEEIAQAGLVDALAWYRSQPKQPVTDFMPKGLPPSMRSADKQAPAHMLPDGLSTSVGGIEAELAAAEYYSLEARESEVPEMGLVRSFLMAPGIWARYTVTRGEPGEPFSDANGNGVYDQGEDYSDTDGNGRWSPGKDTADVSLERGQGSAGTVWYLTSLGEIFKRPDMDQPLGEGSNVRVARSMWGTEIRRLTIAPPAPAALCVSKASDVRLGHRTRITGETAIACAEDTGRVSDSTAEVDGLIVAMPDFDASVKGVFGVEWSKLMSMADISTVDPESGVPSLLPTNGLVVVTGNAHFSVKRPLRGTAVVAVRGDVTIDGNSNPYFSGVLYVDGDLTVRGPALLKGAVVVTGDLDIRGGGGDYVEVQHDPDVVTRLLRHVGHYRYAKSPFRVRDKDRGTPMVEVDPTPDPDPTSDPDGEGPGNKGHGNNGDGVDSDNPGQGNGGPNGGDKSGPDDDEGTGHGAAPSKGKGKGK